MFSFAFFFFATQADFFLYAFMQLVIEERKSWMTKANVTIKVVEGGHFVHMDDAPAIAREVCPWILAQDIGEVARL